MTHPAAAVVADRSAGAILASASGDALGAPHEFGPPLAQSFRLGMTGGGSFGWTPGEWTDDTQMALALLSPLAVGNRDVAAVEKGFLDWFAGRPADVGNQTRAVLLAGPPLRESAVRYQQHHPTSAGNGGLMRIGPAALSFPGQPPRIAEYAQATTALTHPHADCIDASTLWAVAIDHTIHAAPESDRRWDFAAAVRAGLRHLPEESRERWGQLIDVASVRPAVGFNNNGWVVHAFQAALASIVQTPTPDGGPACRHLVAAIETAVRCGGDTDTVAAIAGSLLGARWGASAIPLEWRAVVHGHRVQGQPGLDAGDLDALARRAARGGTVDDLGWPEAARLVPYYVSHHELETRSLQSGRVEFGSVAGLGRALESGASVVISLCRMGTDDVPADVEHHVIGLIDSGVADNPNLAFVLADTADHVAMRVAEGASVYVHCVAAENRTPALAAVYLARHRGMAVDDALDAVQAAIGRRPRDFLVQGVRQAARLGGAI